MEMWLAKSLAERNLGRLPNYRGLSQDALLLADLPAGIRLRNGEIPVGMYAIPDDLLQPPIVITNMGVHVGFETAWQVIDYQNMHEVHGPPTKEEISGVTIVLDDSRNLSIPVRGARDQFRDAFLFLQFLRGVRRALSSGGSPTT